MNHKYLVTSLVAFVFHLSVCAQPRQTSGTLDLHEYDFMRPKLKEFAERRGEELEGQPAALIEKMQMQRLELIRFDIAVLAYYARHNALPERLEQAIGAEYGMDRLPLDLFRPGKPIEYRLSPDKREAVFYSVGPDGNDDKAAKEIELPGDDLEGFRFSIDEDTTSTSKKPVPAGDIVDREKISDLADQRQERKKEMKPLYDKLIADRKKTGRDNAMIHYIEASFEMNDFPYSTWSEYEFRLAQETLRKGWTNQSAPLIGMLARYQKAMDIVRRGAALDYAENRLVLERAPFCRSFAPDQQLCRSLCVDGRRLEAAGKLSDAMNQYLAALTMGRDYGMPQAEFINGAISVGFEMIALTRITHLASNPSLDRRSLELAADRLKTIEATNGRFNDWRATEYLNQEAMVKRFLAISIKDAMQAKDESGKLKAEAERKKDAEEQRRDAGAVESGRRKVRDWDEIRFSISYWERDAKGYGPDDYQKVLNGLRPTQKAGLVNFDGLEIRALTMKAELAEVRAVVAVELFRRDKGAYPDSLGVLVPSLMEKVPMDPFNGKPIQYRKTNGSYRVWSVGPDVKDDAAGIIYDPTNGITSAGDVFFSDRN